MAPRSTTGCYTCKRRKKKCDETKPHCVRCVRSRRECEGYAPLENPDSRGVMRRAKALPTGSVLSQPQLNAPNSMEKQYCSPAGANILDQRRSSDTSSASQWSSTENPLPSSPPETTSNPNAVIPISLYPVKQLTTGHLKTPVASLDPHISDDTPTSYIPQCDDHLAGRYIQDVISFQTQRWPNLIGPCQSSTPDLLYKSLPEAEKSDNLEDNPEGTKEEMCIVPIPDSNTTDNTIPFILQSYAQWVNLVLFEPGKGTDPIKDNILNKFMRSPEERPRIILFANAIHYLGKSIKPSPKATALIAYLSTEAYQNVEKFISNEPASDREADRRNALDALNLVMEVILTRRYFHSLSTIAKFIEAVAAVFRRACPEPMNQYPNLSRAIVSPEINIRNFAASDIILSVTTGRPMLFRYDMTCPPDILELINDGRYGMQWLHGIPDQYIFILGRINVLAEEREFGASVSTECVIEIENQIQQVEGWTDDSDDPLSTVWRFIVRECWRLAMYIYLYMVLCGTRTNDARVLASVESYVRLLRTVKSGRKPDAFLYIPTIIVGASAFNKQHRAVLQRRMLGLQECINPGSCGYDALNILADLWTRTDAENRAAFWSDFRMSAFWVSGI